MNETNAIISVVLAMSFTNVASSFFFYRALREIRFRMETEKTGLPPYAEAVEEATFETESDGTDDGERVIKMY